MFYCTISGIVFVFVLCAVTCIFATLLLSLSSCLVFVLLYFGCFCPVVHGSNMFIRMATY